MQELDCPIVHTPKFNNYYKPVGQFMWVNYMHLGLLGIADYLNRNGMPRPSSGCGKDESPFRFQMIIKRII